MSSPSCLCVTLKRFSNFSSGKSNQNIKISPVLSASKYFDDTIADNLLLPYKYRLVAVVNHLGQSRHAGHYTTTVSTKNKFYQFDDSFVRKVDAVKGDEAYILYYECVKVSL